MGLVIPTTNSNYLVNEEAEQIAGTRGMDDLRRWEGKETSDHITGVFNNQGAMEVKSMFLDSLGFFLLRSAQRFFIAIDRRRLPSGVIAPRRLPVARGRFTPFFGPGFEGDSRSASIALTIRSFSAVRSDKIF